MVLAPLKTIPAPGFRGLLVYSEDETMAIPILVTKLFIPPPRPRAISRSHLVERLNQGLNHKLTLISAPAGFGKTTLVSEWVADCQEAVAWVSLDDGEGDPSRFMAYLIAAIQTVVPAVGEGLVAVLGSPQPPPSESILTALLNEIATLPSPIIIILDDYHLIDAKPVDQAVAFLLDHMPSQLHLVITTREDPQLPLSRLRARDQMTELRAADLRFTAAEVTEFLNPVMGLDLSAADIAALEDRTEGWIAGLQLAAISMQGLQDATGFIQSFTGSHRFVMDYLVDEVLHQQPEHVQTFLLRTSILDELCGPLCDAVLGDPAVSGQETLEYIERTNLFLVPLDSERRWYRYHHLFAELLRQRLRQNTESNAGDTDRIVAELHDRASIWYEERGLDIKAFQHAAAAGNIERAERLVEGKGIPIHVRGGLAPVLGWLESLPASILEANPSLNVMQAMVLTIAGHISRVEPKLQAAEAAMQGREPDDRTRDLIGRIASNRALLGVLAADPHQIDTIIAQSRRALEYLDPTNLSVRAAANWKLGLAYLYKGDRSSARDVFTETIEASEASGNVHVNILATTCLGKVHETDNQLHLAAATYQRALDLIGEPPGPVGCEAHCGLARIFYEWNDLDAAQRHGQLSLSLARQIELASFVTSELFLARLQIAQGDVTGAIASLAETEESVRQRNFMVRMPEVAAVQILALIRQGDLAIATDLATAYDLSLGLAQIHLAEGNARAARAVLDPLRQQVEDKGWEDDRLRAIVLQALACQALGEHDTSLQLLGDALALAEPGGYIRLFVDQGPPMERLLATASTQGIMPASTSRLLAAFPVQPQANGRMPSPASHSPAQSLFEPLSPRELEVLRLIAEGLSNDDISNRLFLAVSTVKGHNRLIYGKLGVQRRTEAVARAGELGLL
jgi:LuxR family maltose regulon positive regulatory protein